MMKMSPTSQMAVILLHRNMKIRLVHEKTTLIKCAQNCLDILGKLFWNCKINLGCGIQGVSIKIHSKTTFRKVPKFIFEKNF